MKNPFQFYLFLVLAFAVLACNRASQSFENATTKVQAAAPDWAKNANIYEVNIRQYTPEGTFKAFQDRHLERLASLGVDILWLMPIFPISETKRKGPLGSYYAVSDFRKVNPEFGTMQDFKSLLNKAHQLEMKVILDWVPNHTGWDHVWIEQHDDWFTKNPETDTIVHPSDRGKPTDWYDVAELNYNNSSLRQQMIADLNYWLTEIGVDGYRMDHAHGVELDFWQTALPAMRAVKPDVFILAEAGEEDFPAADTLFSMSYAWEFHHLMNRIAQGQDSLLSIDRWYQQHQRSDNNGLHMHFITNHDENSWAGTINERLGEAAHAMAVLTFTFEGMPLLYSGQEEGLNKRLKFFEKDAIEWGNYSHQSFYKTLIDLKDGNQALWNGKYGGKVNRIKTDNDKNIYAFYREKGADRVIVILNLTDEAQTVNLLLNDKAGTYSDVFKGRSVRIADNQMISLGAWGYQVLEM